MKTLCAHNITKKYKDIEVLHETNLEIVQGKIYGMLGRNGAGKTTLLSILTAQNPATTGHVTYGGEAVWENEKALSQLCFSREISPLLSFGQNTYRIRDYLDVARIYYPY